VEIVGPEARAFARRNPHCIHPTFAIITADRLEEISRLDTIAESPELVQEIRVEIHELRSRIKTPGTSQPPPPPKKSWQFWN